MDLSGTVQIIAGSGLPTAVEDNFLVGNATPDWAVTTPANARTALGLGSIATQNSNAVSLTGGAIDGTAIGGTTAAAGTFTNCRVNGELRFNGTTDVISGNGSGAVTLDCTTFSIAARTTFEGQVDYEVAPSVTLSGGATNTVDCTGRNAVSLTGHAAGQTLTTLSNAAGVGVVVWLYCKADQEAITVSNGGNLDLGSAGSSITIGGSGNRHVVGFMASGTGTNTWYLIE